MARTTGSQAARRGGGSSPAPEGSTGRMQQQQQRKQLTAKSAKVQVGNGSVSEANAVKRPAGAAGAGRLSTGSNASGWCKLALKLLKYIH